MRLPKFVRTASFRLATGFAILFAVSAILLGAFVYFAVDTILDRHRQGRIDSEIAFLESKFRSQGVAELVEEVGERLATTIANGLDYLVIGPDGTSLAGNLPFVPEGSDWIDVRYPHLGPGAEVDRVRLRVVDLGEGVRLAVGDDLGPAQEINAAVAWAFGWALLALTFIAVAGGAFLSARFLRRVDAITGTAQAIIGGNLSERVPLGGTGDDFDRLSATLNRMLDRIQGLMESLRQISNDIAHELRTPLTRLRHKLEAVAETATSADQERTLLAAIAETDAILETFSALLRIAQIGADTQRRAFRDVDFSRLCGNVCEAFAPAADEEGKTIVAEIEPGVSFSGDPELITQMLANIVENAIQHTPHGTRIVVTLQRRAPEWVASVADDGPGVPGDERQRIFDRFYRIDPGKGTPGSGLGLALAKAIADLHEIELIAENNHPGLRIVMRPKRTEDGSRFVG